MRSTIRRTPFELLLLALLVSASSICAQTKPTSSTHFADKDHTVQLDYPSVWKTMRMANEAVVLVLLPAGEAKDPMVLLTIPPLPQNSNTNGIVFEDVEAGMINGMKANIPDAKVVKAEDATVGDEKADRCVIEGHVGPKKIAIRTIVYFSVHNGKAYAISLEGTFDAVQKNLNDFEQLVKTIQYTD